jgi:hypothetical protein
MNASSMPESSVTNTIFPGASNVGGTAVPGAAVAAPRRLPMYAFMKSIQIGSAAVAPVTFQPIVRLAS